jgi:hypothetical protein
MMGFEFDKFKMCLLLDFFNLKFFELNELRFHIFLQILYNYQTTIISESKLEIKSKNLITKVLSVLVLGHSATQF